MPRKQAKAAESRPPLFTHAAVHGLSFGVLRTHFSSIDNDAAIYIATKLAPGLPHGAGWRPTCARTDVVLPAGVADMFVDPMFLATSYMSSLPPAQKDLLICLKATLDPLQPLHQGWERARSFAVATLARDHGLPVVLVLHDPALVGHHEPNAPHIHLLAFARRLAARGWAERSRLARDEAHDELAEAWRDTK